MEVIYYTYPWAMEKIGGGERQLLAYREHLARNGIKIRLFDMWNPDFGNANIFHCFSVMPGLVEVCDYAKKQGLKLIISPNLWITKTTKNSYPFDSIWNMLYLADYIIVNSYMELRELSDVFGFPETKFKVVYNGAETDFLLPEDPLIFRNKFNILSPYVLNVANIEPRKNQLRFIKNLRQERPDLTFVIAGLVRDQEYAEACRTVGMDKIKIIGPLPYASSILRSALYNCEFFAMPSILETPSIAAIEAATIGSKVLLTANGSTKEYFGDSVTYVDPESDKSIIEGIQSVIKSNSDKSIWVARHSYLWPKVIKNLISLYKEL